MSSRQTELRRLMKAERERQKRQSDESKRAVQATIVADAPKPQGILRVPKHSKTLDRTATAPQEEENGGGGGLGGLLGDYGSDSDSGGESEVKENTRGVKNEEKSDRRHLLVEGDSDAIVGPARPKIAFAPDVKMNPATSIEIKPFNNFGAARKDGSSAEGSSGGAQVGSRGIVAANGAGASSASDVNDGVDPDAWKEFQDLVDDENNGVDRALSAEERMRSLESKELSQEEETHLHATGKAMVSSGGSNGASKSSGQLSKSVVENTSSNKPKKKKKAKDSLHSSDIFVPSTRAEAVEQAAYEARLARLMLLRSRSSKKRRRVEGNEQVTSSTGREVGGKDAMEYAPALAFHEEEKTKEGHNDEEESNENVNMSSFSTPAEPQPQKLPNTIKGKSKGPGNDGSKVDGKRTTTSLLANKIIRRKRAQAKQRSQVEEEDYGW
mmetsp:Transcript_46816/g.141814  ORF Transcript_46816/g.141814 Transcript_46816/m.141814 type:complete len:440 (-) Transcript_46816:241-1560(-)